MKFEKSPLTYKEQIELLKSRGLVFDDEEKAELQLSRDIQLMAMRKGTAKV